MYLLTVSSNLGTAARVSSPSRRRLVQCGGASKGAAILRIIDTYAHLRKPAVFETGRGLGHSHWPRPPVIANIDG